MKNKLLIVGLFSILILASCSHNQNAKDILKKSFEKCQTIENGYYEMDHYMKYMSNKDTSLQVYKCYFKKLHNDSIYSSAFQYVLFTDNEYKREVMYTGDDFVNYSKKDSTGTIMSKKLWAKDIKSYSHNYTFYSPIVTNDNYPLPKDSAFIDDKNIFEFIGEEIIIGVSCYHIRMSIIEDNDSTEMMKTLRAEIDYWISKQDYIPIQYTVAYDLIMNNDTMYQYEKNVLTKYELNNLKDESQLELSSIPSFINLKDYKQYKSPELLPNDTIAPDWTLSSMKDKAVSLSDFKGKLVLLDFFYKACYPCMQALPALQDLHERYHDKGLIVIGINPYDTKEKDDIDQFLEKRGVSYIVLLGGKDIAKKYNVSGYPTMYLIDKEGRIISSKVGYGEGVEAELEEIVNKYL